MISYVKVVLFLHITDEAAWWGEGGLEKLSFAKLEGM